MYMLHSHQHRPSNPPPKTICIPYPYWCTSNTMDETILLLDGRKILRMPMSLFLTVLFLLDIILIHDIRWRHYPHYHRNVYMCVWQSMILWRCFDHRWEVGWSRVIWWHRSGQWDPVSKLWSAERWWRCKLNGWFCNMIVIIVTFKMQINAEFTQDLRHTMH